jgi:hypothetical protein
MTEVLLSSTVGSVGDLQSDNLCTEFSATESPVRTIKLTQSHKLDEP